jgi:hypothetical protein
MRDREVGRERDEVAVRACGVGRLETLVELLEVDATLARRLPQYLGHGVTFLVPDAQAARVPR